MRRLSARDAARGILPLSLGEQPIGLARHARQPFDIGLRSVRDCHAFVIPVSGLRRRHREMIEPSGGVGCADDNVGADVARANADEFAASGRLAPLRRQSSVDQRMSDKRPIAHRKAVFLDLNGTLVLPVKQERLDELYPIPGAVESVARLTAAGFVCPVVTVQSRIAKGLFSTNEFLNWFHDFAALLDGHEARVVGPYVCPHLVRRTVRLQKAEHAVVRTGCR